MYGMERHASSLQLFLFLNATLESSPVVDIAAVLSQDLFSCISCAIQATFENMCTEALCSVNVAEV